MNTFIKTICLFVTIRVLLITAGLAAMITIGLAAPITAEGNKRLSLTGYLTVAGYALIGFLLIIAPLRIRTAQDNYQAAINTNSYPELEAVCLPIKHTAAFLQYYKDNRPQWDGEYVVCVIKPSWLKKHGFDCVESDPDTDVSKFRCSNFDEFDNFLRGYGGTAIEHFLKHRI
jgi:hypothetical protein